MYLVSSAFSSADSDDSVCACCFLSTSLRLSHVTWFTDLGACVVDGEWFQWEQWQPCNVTCGGGNQIRERKCNTPQFGGRTCTGVAMEARDCGHAPCPSAYHRGADRPEFTEICQVLTRKLSLCTRMSNSIYMPSLGSNTDANLSLDRFI